jgi:gliding motility-associated GldM-like protein
MKNFKIIFPLVLLLWGTKILPAQDSAYAAAVTSNGVLLYNKISLNELHDLNALTVFMTENSKTIKIPVASFKITLIERKKEPREFECKSEALTDNIKEMLKEINGGAKIYFEYIKAKMPDGTVRSVSPLALEVI